jgi:hypothetical protein
VRGRRRLLAGLALIALPRRPRAAPAAPWRRLFDGKSLAGWKPTEFGGEGPVGVKGGRILIAPGDPLTGITWAGGELPRTSYEIAVEAMRTRGGDFFCALTVPAGEQPISLIVGGWGGTLVGLSSLDGQDASENETTTTMKFSDNRWYRIRLRVEPERIQAWIDEARVVDVATRGRKLSIRPEVELSRPLGIATYLTGAAIREIKIRRL